MNPPETEATPRHRVLVVDDDKAFTRTMSDVLGNVFDVAVAHDTEEALAQVAAFTPEVVLLDITLDDGVDGFEALARLRALDTPPEVIMLTGMTGLGPVVKAIKGGAFHYVLKDSNPGELANLINQAAERVTSRRRLAALEVQLRTLGGELIAHDPLMLRLMKDVERAAPTSATVLIVGESGTGKELVARRVHELSSRAHGPFVTLSCGGVSDARAESELFGHVKGAFAEAVADRDGCFARARGGTLFLDEVGRASLSLQAMLLRVLESREYLPLGASAPIRMDFRVVASTSHDLVGMGDDGSFLKELLLRLNVFSILLPPLRKRREDIVPLAQYFLDMFSAQMGRTGLTFSAAAARFLTRHEWRGNVRDLRNRIERAVILTANDQEVSVDALSVTRFDQGVTMTTHAEAMDAAQLEYVSRLMNECDWNITQAAKVADLTREGLSRMVAKYGLKDGRM
jgi:DNA-binding NtrC family response regulator